jgi:hypothetical protein
MTDLDITLETDNSGWTRGNSWIILIKRAMTKSNAKEQNATKNPKTKEIIETDLRELRKSKLV